MDAIQLLETDHKNAKKVMEQIAASPPAKKKAIFSNLKRELEEHDSIEENIFYPAVLSNPRTAGFQAQDKEAHKVVEEALRQLEDLEVEDADWIPTFNAMQTRLLNHVADEENNLFLRIRGVLTQTELDALGVRITLEKERRLKAA
jgi:hypothetical protein